MDETPFLMTLIESPQDDVTWSVFADFLEEQGDPRSDHIRTGMLGPQQARDAFTALHALNPNDPLLRLLAARYPELVQPYVHAWMDAHPADMPRLVTLDPAHMDLQVLDIQITSDTRWNFYPWSDSLTQWFGDHQASNLFIQTPANGGYGIVNRFLRGLSGRDHLKIRERITLLDLSHTHTGLQGEMLYALRDNYLVNLTDLHIGDNINTDGQDYFLFINPRQNGPGGTNIWPPPRFPQLLRVQCNNDYAEPLYHTLQEHRVTPRDIRRQMPLLQTINGQTLEQCLQPGSHAAAVMANGPNGGFHGLD